MVRPEIRFLSSGRFRYSLPTGREMSALDRETISHGISSLDLMEQAALAVFACCKVEIFPLYLGRQPRTALILVGPGNNGGDGCVVARALQENGTQVTLVLCAEAPKSSELEVNLKRAAKTGVRMRYLQGENSSSVLFEPLSSIALTELAQDSECIIDALLGSGQATPPRGSIAAGLRAISNASRDGGKLFLSIDLPTGIHGDTGEVFDPCFSPAVTVVIECLKRGMSQYPARKVCGTLYVVGAGIEHGPAPRFEIARPETLPNLTREPDTHKGNLGHVWVVAGSRSMPGAAILAANGAVFSGAGLVTKVTFSGESEGAASGLLPECLLSHLSARDQGVFQPGDSEKLCGRIPKGSSLIIGPGLSVCSSTSEFLSTFLLDLRAVSPKAVVLDADALNIVSQNVEKFVPLIESLPIILTPHPGEAARLLRKETSAIQCDRYAAVEELLSRTNAKVAVLKGASTVIASAEGGYCVLSGNPFMATGGSGDVLSGMIATLAAQCGLTSGSALAAALHGVAGDRIISKRGLGPLPPSLLLREIPVAYSEFCGGNPVYDQ